MLLRFLDSGKIRPLGLDPNEPGRREGDLGNTSGPGNRRSCAAHSARTSTTGSATWAVDRSPENEEFRTCPETWRDYCCLMPWRRGQSGSPHEPSRRQKSRGCSSAPRETQPGRPQRRPPTQPARRVKPVQISAPLHVAQYEEIAQKAKQAGMNACRAYVGATL